MSDELTNSMLAAVEAAESGDDGGGSGADGGVGESGDGGGSAVGTGEATGSAATDDAADGGESGGVPASGQPAVDGKPDAITAELEELGLRTPEPGSNNRIPYPRVRKIVENAIRKREDQHKTLMDEINGKLSTASQRAEAAERVDNLIATDFPRYLQLLETLHPKAKDAIAAYRTPPKPAVADKPQESALPDEPPYDHRFEDGSVGFTPEGARRHQAWMMEVAEARAMSRATALFEEKYGRNIAPLIDERRNREILQQSTELLNAKVSEAGKIWGTTFTEDWAKGDNGDIAKFARANPRASFEQVVQAVLVPKMLADRTKVRKEVLDEGNLRAAAAAKNTSQAAKPDKSSAGPVSLDDQIKEAMAAAGIS